MLAPFITTSDQSGNHQKSWWPDSQKPSLSFLRKQLRRKLHHLGWPTQHRAIPARSQLSLLPKDKKNPRLKSIEVCHVVLTGEIFLLLWRHVPDSQKAKGFVLAISWCSGSYSSGSENMNRLVCHYISARCTLHLFSSILICIRNAFRLKRSTMTTRIQISSCTFKNHCVFAGQYDYWLPPISLPKWNKNCEVGSACDSNAHKNTTFSTACRQTGQL